jgi:hypothetical protein
LEGFADSKTQAPTAALPANALETLPLESGDPNRPFAYVD